MSRIDSRFTYGRVVPGLGILYGLSLAFGLPSGVSRALLIALIVSASFGWMFGRGCGSSERKQHRGERHEARIARHQERDGRDSPGRQSSQGPARTAAESTMPTVETATADRRGPQDTLPGEGVGHDRMPE
ncbi:MAG: hypothetical protein ABI746_04025 [Dermatophilaceae bacterium]